MSDGAMHKEWSSTRSSNRMRPQSTLAKAFSDDLDSLFKIDQPSITDLDAEVFEKKEAVRTHNHELEALEARLRATEERLKNNGVAIPIKPIKETEREPTLLDHESKLSSRPLTAKHDGQAMPGTQPLTPGASDEEEETEEGDTCEEEDDESEDERPATADIAKRRKRAQSLGRRLRHLTSNKQVGNDINVGGA